MAYVVVLAILLLLQAIDHIWTLDPVYVVSEVGYALLVVLVLVDAFRQQRALAFGFAYLGLLAVSTAVFLFSPDDLSEGPAWYLVNYWMTTALLLMEALIIDRRRRIRIYGTISLLTVIPSVLLLVTYQTHGPSAALPSGVYYWLAVTAPMWTALIVASFHRWRIRRAGRIS